MKTSPNSARRYVSFPYIRFVLPLLFALVIAPTTIAASNGSGQVQWPGFIIGAAGAVSVLHFHAVTSTTGTQGFIENQVSLSASTGNQVHAWTWYIEANQYMTLDYVFHMQTNDGISTVGGLTSANWVPGQDPVNVPGGVWTGFCCS